MEQGVLLRKQTEGRNKGMQALVRQTEAIAANGEWGAICRCPKVGRQPINNAEGKQRRILNDADGLQPVQIMVGVNKNTVAGLKAFCEQR